MTLVIGAAVLGLFAEQVLARMGFVAGSDAAFFLGAGVALAYAVTQLLFMAALTLYQPFRSKGPYITESLSNLAALLLLPYVVGVQVPWPHPIMLRAEPVTYVVFFGGIHVFIKAASLYASLEATSGGRRLVPFWFLTAVICVGGSALGLTQWGHAIEEARPISHAESASYRIGDRYAEAKVLPEGSTITQALESYPNQTLTLRWAPLPQGVVRSGDIDRVYVTVTLEGLDTKTYIGSTSLQESSWSEIHVPNSFFPLNVKRCHVRWARVQVPSWQRLLGIRPVVNPEDAPAARRGTYTPPEVLLSGPFEHQVREGLLEPNFLVIGVDGLTANRLTFMGNRAKTTPNIDRLARRSARFTHASSQSRDVNGAYMSLLTGLAPQSHGFSKSTPGQLPESVTTITELLGQQHYVTGAFTESADPNEIPYHAGFGRGFELFDPTRTTYENEPITDSSATLAKAQAWIRGREGQKFFLFVRLSELGEFTPSDRYGRPLMWALTDEEEEEGVELPEPGATAYYDAAVSHIDQQIGVLLQFIRDRSLRRNTCIIITAPHGLDIASATLDQIATQGTAAVRGPSPHVPLVLLVPGSGTTRRTARVVLQDIAPTIARLANTTFDQKIDGQYLFDRR